MSRRLVTLLLTIAAVACERVPQRSATPGETTAAQDPLVHLTELATDPDDGRVAILLHGYGSNELDLIPLARELGLNGRIESFVGPETAGSGYAWFPIDFDQPDGKRYPPHAADEVLPRLAERLGELREMHAPRKLVVVGFSQGAMLTMLLAAEHPDALDQGVALSGALPRKPSPPTGAQFPPLFMAHGVDDDVVSFERGQRAAKTLKSLGVPVEFRRYDGLRHRIDARVVREAEAWLLERANSR